MWNKLFYEYDEEELPKKGVTGQMEAKEYVCSMLHSQILHETYIPESIFVTLKLNINNKLHQHHIFHIFLVFFFRFGF